MAYAKSGQSGDCHAASQDVCVLLLSSPFFSPCLTRSADQAPSDQDPNGPNIQHIDIEQTATGGIKGTTEKRALDWTYRGHSDWLFGELQGRSRMNTIAKILEDAKGKGVEEEDAKF